MVAAKIAMPKLGLTMTEGTVVEWLIEDGQAVEKGQAVVVIETDKSNVELEAEATGTLHRVASVGAVLPVEGVIGHVLESGESAGDVADEG